MIEGSLQQMRLVLRTQPDAAFAVVTLQDDEARRRAAITADGTVYVAGDYVLTKWAPNVGCTEVARSSVQLPASLATAIVAGKEELVGYVGMQFVSTPQEIALIDARRAAAMACGTRPPA